MAQLESSFDFQHALTTYCSAGAQSLASHIARRHLLPLHHTQSTGPCPWPACAFDGDARSLAQHFVHVHYIFLVPDLDHRVAQDLSNLTIINEAKDPKRKARSSEAASSGNAIADPSTTAATASPSSPAGATSTPHPAEPPTKKARVPVAAVPASPADLSTAVGWTAADLLPKSAGESYLIRRLTDTSASTKYKDLVVTSYEWASLAEICRARDIPVYDNGERVKVDVLLRALGVKVSHACC